MVEMRWVERKVITESFAGSLKPLREVTQQVLQYRHPIPYLGADGNIHASHSRGAIDWSEWIDVPTVTEG